MHKKTINKQVQSLKFELILLSLITAILAILAIQIDGFELLVEYVEQHEEYELDEVITISIFMSIAIAIFAFRRFQDLRFEIERNKQIQVELEHTSKHDPLTALPNRRYFDEKIRQLLKQQSTPNSQVILILCDLNKFKQINDIYGHFYGDLVLKNTARRLQQLNSGYFVARLGGDEFALVWHSPEGGHSSSTIKALCLQIEACIIAPIEHDNITLNVSASLGVAIHQVSDKTNVEEFLQQADFAMYQSKESTNRCMTLYDETMRKLRERKHLIESALKTALEHQQFFIVFQPQFYKDGELYGFEAFVRWRHSKLGLIKPNEFIPIASDCSLIHHIDFFVIEEACKQAFLWPSSISVAINLSEKTIQHPEFIDKIQKILASCQMAPHRITFEISEGLFFDNQTKYASTINELKSLGVHLVLDNFGHGYANIHQLRYFTFDKIKINRSLFDELPTTVNQQNFIKAIVNMVSCLDIDVIANGIETDSQYQTWQTYDCRYFQGDFLSKSLTEPQVLELIEHQQESRNAPKKVL